MGYRHTDRMHHDTTPCEGRGEVWVRGPGVFMGYYKDEEETQAVGIREPGGWLKSGDIGDVLTFTHFHYLLIFLTCTPLSCSSLTHLTVSPHLFSLSHSSLILLSHTPQSHFH